VTATAQRLHLENSDRPTSRCEQWLEIAPLLDHCSHHFRSLLRQCAASERLNERQALILWLCWVTPDGTAQVDLARQLALSPAQLCQLLEQLRGRSLLQCVRDPEDRRRQRHQLTAAGRAAWHEIRTALTKELQAEPAEAAGPLRQLYGLLDSFLAAAPQEPRLRVVPESPEGEAASREDN
jgi:DNA-binding MarR family transcriptional regulator